MYVAILFWATVFGHAFRGIRQQHVYLLEGLCRVVYYSFLVVQMDLVWVYMCRFDVFTVEVVEVHGDHRYMWGG